MSQPVAHTQDFLFNNNKKKRKKTSIDCLSERRWLGILRNFASSIHICMRVVEWVRWVHDEDVQRIWFYEWMRPGQKRWECSFPFMKLVNNIHMPKNGCILLVFHRSFLSSKFSNSDKWLCWCCYCCLHNIKQHSYDSFVWQFWLESSWIVVSPPKDWVAVKMTNQWIKRNQQLM